VGFGTVLFAVTIGPITHVTIRSLAIGRVVASRDDDGP
jgi:hypothetical protein